MNMSARECFHIFFFGLILMKILGVDGMGAVNKECWVDQQTSRKTDTEVDRQTESLSASCWSLNHAMCTHCDKVWCTD